MVFGLNKIIYLSPCFVLCLELVYYLTDVCYKKEEFLFIVVIVDLDQFLRNIFDFIRFSDLKLFLSRIFKYWSYF